jgi:glycosyltransferase involved in cell wall biosynthesis
MPETTVVLATYNGERYIAELLESLIAQTYRDFDVVVSDDCSTDQTVSIIESFQSELSISVSKNGANVGPSLNFSRATKLARGRFIAFADQDDFWHPDKLLLMVDLLKTQGDQKPCLIFCDLKITDEKLNTTNASYFSGSKSSTCGHIEDFFISNHIPGCAMLINRPLLELGEPVPPKFRMHDWWYALIAAAFGTISYLDRPLVLYRQHANNTIGAAAAGIKIEKKKSSSKIRRLITAPRAVLLNRTRILREQANMIKENVAAFSERFSESLDDRGRKALRAFQHKRYFFSRLRLIAGAELGETKLNALLIFIIL